MPGPKTHDIFYKSLKGKLNKRTLDSFPNYDQYNIFVQGHDFLIYYDFYNSKVRDANIENSIHLQEHKFQEFVYNYLYIAKESGALEKEDVRLFIGPGYIMHHLLDAYTHPQIIYYAGDHTKNPEYKTWYHGILENLLDVYMMETYEGKNAKTYKVYKDFQIDEALISNALIRTIDESSRDELSYYTKHTDKGTCTTELSEKIKGLVTVSQIGNANFALNPIKQYSGGGFDFNINYSSRASYSICDSLQYEITEWYPVYTCPTKADISGPMQNYGSYTTSSSTSYGNGILNGNQCTYNPVSTTTITFRQSDYIVNRQYYNNVCGGSVISCSGLCSCKIFSMKPSVTGDANQVGCASETTTYNCSGGNPAYNCSNSSEEIKMLSEEMASHISYPDFSVNSEVKSRDSNDEKATGMVSMNGEWTIEHGNVSQWYPDTMITFSAWYELGKACINAKTADVRYISKDSNCDSNEEIDGGFLYYIPLKEKTGTNFPVEVYIQELSIVNIMNWQLNYKCGVDCQQKLFDLDKGGYLYYFRPISLTEPFPNRDPGVNWINWISVRQNQERLKDTYSTVNNLEYTVTLTLNDINTIKEYNKNSNRGYLDYSININGESSFIKSSNVFSLGNPNYSGLGVYDPEDDKQ